MLFIPYNKNRQIVSLASGRSQDKLPLAWQWNHNPDHNLWSVDARPGYLRLTTGRVDTDVLNAKNMLTQRTFGPESSATIAMETDQMKDGDYAGFIALQKLYGFVGVKKEGNRKSIVMTAQKDKAPAEYIEIPFDKSRVYFRIDCDYNPENEQQRKDKAYFYYSLDGECWGGLVLILLIINQFSRIAQKGEN